MEFGEEFYLRNGVAIRYGRIFLKSIFFRYTGNSNISLDQFNIWIINFPKGILAQPKFVYSLYKMQLSKHMRLPLLSLQIQSSDLWRDPEDLQ